jgi:hypothetical protein
MMMVLKKIKSFFKRPKAQARAEQPKPTVEAAEEKATEAAEKKASEASGSS